MSARRRGPPDPGRAREPAGGSALGGIVLFVAVLIALFVASGHFLSGSTGGAATSVAAEGVTLASGEAIFWGPGRCHTCHSVGSRGSSVRGPDLGSGDLGPRVGRRAESRARERSRELGEPFDRTDYLVESLVAPGRYVVGGFSNEMPEAHRPPVSLEADEIRSVVLYLQSLGGEPAPDSIRLPAEATRDRSGELEASGSGPILERVQGDSARGRRLFFEPDGLAACSACHAVDGRGGDVGPELTGVASVRGEDFLLESLLSPGASIASGYETTVVRTVDGRILDGVLTRESEDSVWLADSNAAVRAVSRARIDTMRTQEVSVMPENFDQLLTVRQLADLMAFLRSLR